MFTHASLPCRMAPEPNVQRSTATMRALLNSTRGSSLRLLPTPSGVVGAKTSAQYLPFLKITYKSAQYQVPLGAWQQLNYERNMVQFTYYTRTTRSISSKIEHNDCSDLRVPRSFLFFSIGSRLIKLCQNLFRVLLTVGRPSYTYTIEKRGYSKCRIGIIRGCLLAFSVYKGCSQMAAPFGLK